VVVMPIIVNYLKLKILSIIEDDLKNCHSVEACIDYIQERFPNETKEEILRWVT